MVDVEYAEDSIADAPPSAVELDIERELMEGDLVADMDVMAVLLSQVDDQDVDRNAYP